MVAMYLPRIRPALTLTTGAAAAALLLSCADHTGPREPVPAHLAVAPGFASAAAGIVPLAHGRILLTRVPSGDIAKDTVIALAPAQDSVDLSLTVMLLEPNETFLLTIALTTPAGDTAFRAGPIEVTPSTGGAPTPVPVTFVYVGVGANAASVAIGTGAASVFIGDTVTLTATALDAGGTAIPGTPIAWRSLDTLTATVPVEATGRVVGRASGSARIVAELLTGPADTALVGVLLPPAAIAADSGSGQTAPAGSALPERLVARITASDGSGVANVWVRFAVTLGGGTVSADSVLTDATGRGGVAWTLGNVVGTQTVTATTARLAGASASFTATSTPTGAGAIAIAAGDAQSALVGTAVATAPSVLVTDGQGNPIPNVGVTFAVTQGNGSLTGATPTTDGNGIATVGSWTLGPTVGLNALSATVTGLTPVQFVALGTGAGGATTMTVSTGNGQTALAGTAVPIAPAVLLTDTAGAPVAGATVFFTVTSGGGTVTGDTATSGASGVAAAGSWTLGTPGLNELTASAAGLPDVVFQATGTVGAAYAVVKISGDAQSADAGTALPQPLTVEVQDSVGNPVANVAVAWSTLNGSITPATGNTDAAGQAQASWTLGTNALTQTATGTVTGLTPVVFSATAVFPNPSILLALQGTDRIRLGDSVLMDVTLTAPAGSGGVVLNFSVDNPALVGLDTTDLSIPQNGTSTQLWLYGLSQGTTTARAIASGYADGALSVLVTVQVLSMPRTLNVPYGGTASLPLQISTPAPTGGVTITLVSDNPTAVGVVTPTVTVPEGQQTANAILSGVAPGTATVTGTTAAFGIAQTAAATRANLNIVETSATIPQTFADTVTVRLESSGSSVAAPSPGIPVTLTARNPDCVAATSPITIPTGLVSATTIVTYAGVATTPCTTYLVAESPAIQPDSIPITVNPPPGISVSNLTLGAGLQQYTYTYLGAANHGGVNVVIKSQDPAIALVAAEANLAGADSVVKFLPNGQTSVYYYAQALEGVADGGPVTVPVTVSAPGFNTATSTHTVRRPAFDILNLPTNTTTLSDSSPFYVVVGYHLPNYSTLWEYQAVRAGAQPLSVTVASGTPGVARLVTLDSIADAVTVQIQPQNYYSPTTVAGGGVAFDPLTAGTTTVSASITGFDPTPGGGSIAVTVNAPGITMSEWTVGSGLQRNVYGYLGASGHGGVNVVVKSSAPGVARVAPDDTTPGTDSAIVFVPDGSQYFSYYVQGMEGQTGTVTTTARATGFTDGTAPLNVVQPALGIYNLPGTIAAGANDAPFYAQVGIPYASNQYLSEYQAVRAGGNPLTVSLTSGTPSVGRLVTSTQTGGSVTVQIQPGYYYSPTTVGTGGAAFDPLASGTSVVTAAIPGFLTTSVEGVRTVTVTP
jgi:hypothetical protein